MYSKAAVKKSAKTGMPGRAVGSTSADRRAGGSGSGQRQAEILGLSESTLNKSLQSATNRRELPAARRRAVPGHRHGAVAGGGGPRVVTSNRSRAALPTENRRNDSVGSPRPGSTLCRRRVANGFPGANRREVEHAVFLGDLEGRSRPRPARARQHIITVT